jgi:hypothetical protein
MNTVLEALLTQKRLAERLNQSERTLERWRIEGTGPVYVKAGRKVLYLPRDVEEWLLETRRRSTSSPSAPSSGVKEPTPQSYVAVGEMNKPASSLSSSRRR